MQWSGPCGGTFASWSAAALSPHPARPPAPAPSPPAPCQENLYPEYSEGNDYAVIFKTIFPALTGMFAGNTQTLPMPRPSVLQVFLCHPMTHKRFLVPSLMRDCRRAAGVPLPSDDTAVLGAIVEYAGLPSCCRRQHVRSAEAAGAGHPAGHVL